MKKLIVIALLCSVDILIHTISDVKIQVPAQEVKGAGKPLEPGECTGNPNQPGCPDMRREPMLD